MTMAPQKQTGKSARIRERILREIEIGNYPREFALPSERLMAQSHGVSYMTMRKVIGQLVDKHYLERRPNIGTFVCASIPEEKVRKQLGVVIPAWSAPEITDLIMHLTEAAEAVNWQLKLIYARSWEDRAIPTLYDESNGLICIAISDQQIPEQLLQRFRSQEKPILFWHAYSNENFDAVESNFAPMLLAAAETLYTLGHRKIARIEQISRCADQVKPTHPGFDQCLEQFAASHPDVTFDTVTLQLEAPHFKLMHQVIYDKLQEFTPGNFPFTALISPLSFYLGVAAGVAKLGLRVPEDISILCFGDSQEAKFYLPEPARVCTRLRQRAIEAVNLVLAREKNPGLAPAQKTVEPEFVAGQTLACCKK